MWLMHAYQPPIGALATANPRQTSFMRHAAARRPNRPASLPAGGWIPLTAISPLLIAAAVNAEDPRFFDHHGVDWSAVRRALREAKRARRIVRGASTITQQLARNLYLTPARSLVRKLRELRLAVRLERALSKPRILELYLNVVEWGVGVWGCSAAAEHYFQKTPRDLDLFESTFLVSLLPAPTAAMSGRNAMRSRSVQVSLAHWLFLSGLVTGQECAMCSHRVQRLHGMLAAGTPLPEALVQSKQVDTGLDGTVLDCLAAELGLARLDPVDLITSRCGSDQQRTALGRVRERFGDAVLFEVDRTGDYALLTSASPSRRAREHRRMSPAPIQFDRTPHG
jgi:monofunctional biosynthetic peptidoglycan transglycosylase